MGSPAETTASTAQPPVTEAPKANTSFGGIPDATVDPLERQKEIRDQLIATIGPSIQALLNEGKALMVAVTVVVDHEFQNTCAFMREVPESAPPEEADRIQAGWFAGTVLGAKEAGRFEGECDRVALKLRHDAKHPK